MSDQSVASNNFSMENSEENIKNEGNNTKTDNSLNDVNQIEDEEYFVIEKTHYKNSNPLGLSIPNINLTDNQSTGTNLINLNNSDAKVHNTNISSSSSDPSTLFSSHSANLSSPDTDIPNSLSTDRNSVPSIILPTQSQVNWNPSSITSTDLNKSSRLLSNLTISSTNLDKNPISLQPSPLTEELDTDEENENDNNEQSKSNSLKTSEIKLENNSEPMTRSFSVELSDSTAISKAISSLSPVEYTTVLTTIDSPLLNENSRILNATSTTYTPFNAPIPIVQSQTVILPNVEFLSAEVVENIVNTNRNSVNTSANINKEESEEEFIERTNSTNILPIKSNSNIEKSNQEQTDLVNSLVTDSFVSNMGSVLSSSNSSESNNNNSNIPQNNNNELATSEVLSPHFEGSTLFNSAMLNNPALLQSSIITDPITLQSTVAVNNLKPSSVYPAFVKPVVISSEKFNNSSSFPTAAASSSPASLAPISPIIPPVKPHDLNNSPHHNNNNPAHNSRLYHIIIGVAAGIAVWGLVKFVSELKYAFALKA